MDVNYKKSLTSIIILITISITVYFLIRGIDKLFTPTPTASPTYTPVITILPSEYPDFDAFNSMRHRLTIAENSESYSPKGKPVVGRITKQLIVKGQFSRIYIYVEASVDAGKPLTQWDSVYMAMGNTGGHLFRSQSLKVPESTITRLLYALNQVPIITTVPYSENKPLILLDWFSQFTDGNKIAFNSFISSLRLGGKFNRIELGYECEPPDGSCGVEIK